MTRGAAAVFNNCKISENSCLYTAQYTDVSVCSFEHSDYPLELRPIFVVAFIL